MSGVFITDRQWAAIDGTSAEPVTPAPNTTIKAPIAFEALFWSPLVNYSCSLSQKKSCPFFFRVRNSQCTNDRLEGIRERLMTYLFKRAPSSFQSGSPHSPNGHTSVSKPSHRCLTDTAYTSVIPAPGAECARKDVHGSTRLQDNKRTTCKNTVCMLGKAGRQVGR